MLDVSTMLTRGAQIPRLTRTLSRSAPSAFVRGPEERNLILFVDNERLPPSPELDALLELGCLDEVDLTVTSPVDGLSHLTIDWDSVHQNTMNVWTKHPDGSRVLTGIDWVRDVLEDAKQYSRRYCEPLEETERRFLVVGAALLRSDGVVLAGSYPPNRKANVLSPAEAVSVLGLYLRSRGMNVIGVWPGPPLTHFKVDAGTQRTRVLRTVISGAGRWLAGCNGVRAATGDDFLQREASGLFTRVNRALFARDAVAIECLVPSSRSSHDMILYHLDALLLWLGGAFDILATVADHSTGIGADQWLIGWRSRKWRRTLAKTDQNLHALTEPSQPAGAVIELVAQLRNTIHGAPIHPVRYSGSGYSNEIFIELPGRAAAGFKAAVDVLGGPAPWGEIQAASAVRTGSIWDPLPLVQRLIPTAMTAMSAIMEATPVDRLPARNDHRPRAGFRQELPDPVPRSCLLHGFAPDSRDQPTGSGQRLQSPHAAIDL